MDLLRLYLRALGWGAARVLGEDGLDQLRDELRRALGVAPERADPVPVALKERGAELLAGDSTADTAHPSCELILDSLVPDEARILRLIAIEGARATVDVRNRRERVAQNLNLIARDAKLQRAERVPAYLANLQRLGLVRFSQEPLQDDTAYGILEVQPEVRDALTDAGRGRTVRRSIHMTPFGRDFCETCLPIDTAGFLAIQDDVRNLRA